MPFQMYISPIFWWSHILAWCETRPMKAESIYGYSPSKNKKRNSQAFLGINKYLSKFFPSTADVFESLRQLTSSKTEWTWNATYQKLFEKAKSIITEDAGIKFYDETHHCTWRQMHLESDPELSSYKPEVVKASQETKAERRYSNIER